MKLIFIYGLPATGKLTVAQELASMTGFRLFHNHLAVDLLLSVFEFGSPSFVALREEIWLSVFTEACRSELEGLIFTFAPEVTVRPDFIASTQSAVAKGGGEIEFIELVCPLPELKKRLENTSRLRYGKLTSLPLFEHLHAAGSLDTFHMPKARISIDTSLLTAAQAAARIAHALALSPSHEAVTSTFN